MDPQKKPGLTPRSCEVCHRKDNLLRCSGCQSVYYCGREHQTSDRSVHKQGCITVKKARSSLEREEQKLRNTPGDMFLPENIFETEAGRFWGIVETRPYMCARQGMVDALLQYFGSSDGRVDAVETALAHLLDMLRLCRKDNLGVRDMIPALYVALDRDQEAYDFSRWWAEKDEDSRYDWGNMSLPYLNTKNADILEPPMKNWTGDGWMNLAHASVVTLIKLRVLANLQNIQSVTRAFAGVLPANIIDIIRGHLAGKALGARPDLLKGDTEKVGRLMKTLRRQALRLYRSIKRYNPHFWSVMMKDDLAKGKTQIPCFSPGSEEEAYLVLGHTVVAWVSSPEATRMIYIISMYG